MSVSFEMNESETNSSVQDPDGVKARLVHLVSENSTVTESASGTRGRSNDDLSVDFEDGCVYVVAIRAATETSTSQEASSVAFRSAYDPRTVPPSGLGYTGGFSFKGVYPRTISELQNSGEGYTLRLNGELIVEQQCWTTIDPVFLNPDFNAEGGLEITSWTTNPTPRLDPSIVEFTGTEGEMPVFLAGDNTTSYIEQEVTVQGSGYFKVNGYWGGNPGFIIELLVDGVSLGTTGMLGVTATSPIAMPEFGPFYLTSGTHTLRFKDAGSATADSNGILDSVSITRV